MEIRKDDVLRAAAIVAVLLISAWLLLAIGSRLGLKFDLELFAGLGVGARRPNRRTFTALARAP